MKTEPGATDVWVGVPGIVVAGYGVASGLSGDPRFPNGTIAEQLPIFHTRGIDLRGMYAGTVNVSIAPAVFSMEHAWRTVRGVHWTRHFPPEDFSFSPCRLSTNDKTVDALVYYPHPETKPDHHQSRSTLEILAPRVAGITYGTSVTLLLRHREIAIRQPE